jgi:hypothetical protein
MISKTAPLLGVKRSRGARQIVSAHGERFDHLSCGRVIPGRAGAEVIFELEGNVVSSGVDELLKRVAHVDVVAVIVLAAREIGAPQLFLATGFFFDRNGLQADGAVVFQVGQIAEKRDFVEEHAAWALERFSSAFVLNFKLVATFAGEFDHVASGRSSPFDYMSAHQGLSNKSLKPKSRIPLCPSASFLSTIFKTTN